MGIGVLPDGGASVTVLDEGSFTYTATGVVNGIGTISGDDTVHGSVSGFTNANGYIAFWMTNTVAHSQGHINISDSSVSFSVPAESSTWKAGVEATT